ncbi:SCO family protein [Piscinibacter sp.]|uniref:SCO family protein n=1 Tax=Piscinibacter sp. TaxID=1903157 RepID=UPI0039E57422
MSGSNSSVRGSQGAPEAASPLSFTVHSMPEPGLAEAGRRTATGRVKMLLILLVCAAPVIASYFSYFVIRPEGRTNYGTLISPQVPLPEALPLADPQGRAVAAASLHGQWLLVVVGGGDCDAACEKRLWLQRQLREALGRDKDRLDKVWLVDDAQPLRAELMQALNAGEPVTVLRAPREALAQWLKPAEGAALEAHFYIVDPRGHWMMRAPGEPDAARLRRDLEKLMRGSAGWDSPGRP